MGAKNVKSKFVTIDERGRVTLPAETRQGVETFSLEVLKDGSIKLTPQEVVSIADAALLKSLKKSVAQAKRGELEDVPDDWID
jgi:hypothetical protein